MNYLKKEYIGKKVKIENSKNKNYMGINGIVIDETKNTFKIKENNKKRIILKKGTEFMFVDNKIKIDGLKILKKPQDRIKIR
ncbi:MAG: ribonuclease P component 1 family protein [Candidatus Woesearchaeota archaeon]